jgi:hypothetical protein
MKKIIKFLSFSLLVSLAIVSCNEDETTFNALSFPTDSFTFIEGESIDALEASTEEIEIVILRATSNDGAQSELEVPFTITTEGAVEGRDFEIVNQKSRFKFAAGVFKDILKIKLIDNLIEDGNKKITINLTEGANIGYPGDIGAGTSFTLNINDDDCSLIAENFTGTPSGTETTSYTPEESPSTAKFTLVSSTSTTATYSIEGIYSTQLTTWGETITSGGSYEITLDLTDPANPLVIPTDNGDPLGNGLNFFYAETDNQWGYYLNLDAGTFSTCGKTLELEFTIDVTRAIPSGVFLGDGKTRLILQF